MVVGEELEHLLRHAQDAFPVAAPLALARLERGVLFDRDEHVLEFRPARVMGMDVAGDDRLDARVLGEIAQECVPLGVPALERPLQLDVEAVGAERVRQLGGSVWVADAEPIARAAGEADKPLGKLGEQ